MVTNEKLSGHSIKDLDEMIENILLEHLTQP